MPEQFKIKDHESNITLLLEAMRKVEIQSNPDGNTINCDTKTQRDLLISTSAAVRTLSDGMSEVGLYLLKDPDIGDEGIRRIAYLFYELGRLIKGIEGFSMDIQDLEPWPDNTAQ